jgi:hypothetical protein
MDEGRDVLKAVVLRCLKIQSQGWSWKEEACLGLGFILELWD